MKETTDSEDNDDAASLSGVVGKTVSEKTPDETVASNDAFAAAAAATRLLCEKLRAAYREWTGCDLR